MIRQHGGVLRYDSRGHGQSAVTPGPYTIEQLGRDVVALLDALDLIPARPGIRLVSVVVFVGLSIALTFSAIPLMVQLVLGFQVRIGNANRPVIRALIARQRVIVFVLWSLIALGLAIAVPAAILDGAFDTTEVAAPSALGSYLWRAVVTPLAPDRRTLRQGRAYEVRALVPVPNRLTLGGRYSAGQAILSGRLTAGGKPRARVQVRIVKLARVITPSGVVFRDAVAGFVRTDRTGRFTFRARLPKTAGFVAFVDEGSTRCSGRSIAPGGCEGTSIAGTGSEAVTVSVR